MRRRGEARLVLFGGGSEVGCLDTHVRSSMVMDMRKARYL